MNIFIKNQGFTLLELLIVIAFVGIIMAIGIPNFSKWKEKYEINGQAQKVYFDMMLARSTSVKNNNNVSVTFDIVKIYTRYTMTLITTVLKTTGNQ